MFSFQVSCYRLFVDSNLKNSDYAVSKYILGRRNVVFTHLFNQMYIYIYTTAPLHYGPTTKQTHYTAAHYKADPLHSGPLLRSMLNLN